MSTVLAWLRRRFREGRPWLHKTRLFLGKLGDNKLLEKDVSARVAGYRSRDPGSIPDSTILSEE
jgi:hypothetical protein